MSDSAARDEEDSAYCREVEAYLCRRNGGHLVRLVGPSFECVRGWAVRGIPLKIVFEGIDRRVDRARARGPQRRPVRAEFCEADVLDVFDEWRRALGLPAAMNDAHEDAPAEERESRKVSLARHIERVTARLIALRGRTGVPARLNEAIGASIDELDAAYPGAKGARGDARARLIELLNQADAGLLEAARESAGDAAPALRQAADAEIAAYRARMTADTYAQSLAAATDRLLRQHFALPTLRVDG